MSRQDKATTERHAKILRELVKRPENKLCADCKRNDPRWASWNIGVFLCIRCSGIHRGMGTHISRVKSIDLDTWTPDQMESIQKWGNRRANLYWEAHLKQGHSPPDHKLESFVRSKYDSRRWALEGPPPGDPSVLDSLPASSEPVTHSPAPAVQSSAPAAANRGKQLQTTVNDPRTNRTLLSTSTDLLSPSPLQRPSDPSSQEPVSKSNNDDLFSLDFSAPATSRSAVQTSQPTQQPIQKDVKQDILSLFNANTSPTSASRASAMNSSNWPTAHAASQSIDTWSFGASSDPWNSSQAAQPTLNASDIWGTGHVANSQADGLGHARQEGSTSAPSSSTKHDAFGDIWSQLR